MNLCGNESLILSVQKLVGNYLNVDDESSVLVIGDYADDLVSIVRQKNPLLRCETLSFEEVFQHSDTKPNPILSARRWSMALVLQFNADKNCFKGDFLPGLKNLLSGLRDVHAETVLHVVASNYDRKDGWSINDSLAMGFYVVENLNSAQQAIALYEFNIQSYKSSPQWLNAAHWAHPERWKP